MNFRKLRLLALLTPVLAGVSCQPDDIIEEAVRVTGVSVDPTVASIYEEETLQLKAVITPSGAAEQDVEWSSNNERAAVVDQSGLVTAVRAGNATITVTTRDGGFTARCRIAVQSKDTPTPQPGPDPVATGREWPDTGADVPAYPSYNPVSSLADFPRINLTTDSGQAVQSKTDYEGGTITFLDPREMYSEVTEVKNLKMKIRGRGNTTWEGPWGSKNSYRIKLDEHTKLFGMKGDKDWILLADKLDPSMMRTAVAFRISRLVSMPWTPKFRMAELYLNGKYAGLYYLMEHKEADRENKVPITVATPGVVEDGGYLLELDNKWDEDAYFISSVFEKKVKYKDPDPNDDDEAERMTSAQKAYITNYFNKLERKLSNREFTGDDSYREYIEMDSWIQNFFVHELSMNIDGNMRLSTYFAKDGDTKLFMPFVWDFDRAFGNASYQTGDFALPESWPYGWYVRIRGGYPDGESSNWTYTKGRRPSWYQYLFEDPVFVARVKELWELYKPRLEMIPEFMDKMLEYNQLAYKHNDTKFYNGYDSAVRKLRSDYVKRLQWMDTNIRSLEPQRYNPTTGNFENL